MLFNLQYGGGAEGPLSYLLPPSAERRTEKLEEIAGALGPHRPDVLGMVEVDAGSWRTGGINQAVELAQRLALPHVDEYCKYPPPFDQIPGLSHNTLAIASNRPLTDTRAHQLSAGFKRRAVSATIEGITFIVCHLSLAKYTRVIQTADLARIVRSIEGPVVVMGDFNAQPGTVEMEGLVKGADLRMVSPGSTFPSWKPKRSLDHFFVSADVSTGTASVLDVVLSDHLPVTLDVSADGGPKGRGLQRIPSSTVGGNGY